MILRIHGLLVVGIDGIISLRMHDDYDNDPLKKSSIVGLAEMRFSPLQPIIDTRIMNLCPSIYNLPIDSNHDGSGPSIRYPSKREHARDRSQPEGVTPLARLLCLVRCSCWDSRSCVRGRHEFHLCHLLL